MKQIMTLMEPIICSMEWDSYVTRETSITTAMKTCAIGEEKPNKEQYLSFTADKFP